VPISDPKLEELCLATLQDAEMMKLKEVIYLDGPAHDHKYLKRYKSTGITEMN